MSTSGSPELWIRSPGASASLAHAGSKDRPHCLCEADRIGRHIGDCRAGRNSLPIRRGELRERDAVAGLDLHLRRRVWQWLPLAAQIDDVDLGGAGRLDQTTGRERELLASSDGRSGLA